MDNQLFARFIKSGDSYVESQKPLVLIIHGLYSSCANWYAVGKGLAERVAGCEVCLIDLPGHGHSPWSGVLSYEDACSRIQHWIECHVAYGRRLIIVGHSFGARVALILASRLNRYKVEGVVMIDMSPFVEKKKDRIISTWHALLLARMVEAKEAGVKNIDTYLHNNGVLGSGLSMDMPYRQMDMLSARDGVRGLVHEYLAMNTPDFWTNVSTIKLMIIRGGDSQYVSLEDRDLLDQKFQDHQLVTIDGASHDIHHSQKQQLIDRLVEFVESIM